MHYLTSFKIIKLFEVFFSTELRRETENSRVIAWESSMGGMGKLGVRPVAADLKAQPREVRAGAVAQARR